MVEEGKNLLLYILLLFLREKGIVVRGMTSEIKLCQTDGIKELCNSIFHGVMRYESEDTVLIPFICELCLDKEHSVNYDTLY